MSPLEAAKSYVEKNDPNHWLTKDLQKAIDKGKIPNWAIKELAKKSYLPPEAILDLKVKPKPNQLGLDFSKPPVENVEGIEQPNVEKIEKVDPYAEVKWDNVEKKWIFPEGITSKDLPQNLDFFEAHFGVPPLSEEALANMGETKKAKRIFSWQECIDRKKEGRRFNDS